MCVWGTEELVEVTVPAHLSSTSTAKRKIVGIDACIAPLVRALDSAGIVMTASCCGHGEAIGRIDLEDGCVLLIVGGPMASDIHVIPSGDTLEYLELRQCWCRPTIEDVNGTALVTHNSADGREYFESEPPVASPERRHECL